jgi:hypothetical protein
MLPGERRVIAFTTERSQRGFRNRGDETRIVPNGTFVDNGEITPSIGVSRDAFLKDRAKRRKYGLPADLRPPTLGRKRPRAQFDFLTPTCDWVDADITITTDADQVPIAPGYTLSDTSRRMAAAPRGSSDRCADQPLLLDPVRPLRDRARRGTRSVARRSTWPSTTSPAMNTTCRA